MFFRNEHAFKKTARSEGGDSSQSFSGTPWLEKAGSRNVSDVDREVWDLVDDAEAQSEEDDIDDDDDIEEEIELDKEDGKQESSTETSTVHYDELR